MRGRLAMAGWGLYCSCSWTWCVGMFLPIILLDRFGWPGYLAFLIPNMLGCTAFGFVVKSAARSREMIDRHGAAMRWFSIVAIAFYVFFVAFAELYLWPGGAARAWLAPVAAVGLLVIGFVLSGLSRRWWPILAIAVYAGSASVLLTGGLDQISQLQWSGSLTRADLLWLTPVLCFGFLLCPLLDLTFHRAMQETNHRSTFVVFALTFVLMTYITCTYPGTPVAVLIPVLALHVVVQSVFTVAAHIRELRGETAKGLTGRDVAVGIGLLAAAAPPIVLSFVDASYEIAERAYLCWMVFYGLVFPAYVLVFMIRNGAIALNARSLTRFALVMLAATPFYWFGFIEESMWALAPPLIALLGWRMFIETRGTMR